MKLYPDNLEEKIDFDKIKDLIRQECTGVLGADFVKKIAFSKDRRLLSRLLTQTEEFRQILVSGDPFPSNNYINIYPYLNKAKIEGTFLFEEDYWSLV